MSKDTLYLRLIDAGVPERDIDNHCSDLYVAVTYRSKEVISKWCEEQGKPMPSTFKSQDETPPRRTYEIPFAYDPFWDEAQDRDREVTGIPASPYYAMQKQAAPEGRLKDFTDELDAIEAEIPVCLKSGTKTSTCVSVASFLFGFCGHLAKRWAREGFPIITAMDGEELLHVFNCAQARDGRMVFLDARGATTSLEEVLAPFQRKSVQLILTEGEKALEQVPDWAFKEDEYSEAMISWLLRRAPNCYDFTGLQKPEDIAFNIKEVL